MFFYKMSANKVFGMILSTRSLVFLRKEGKNYRLWLGLYLEKKTFRVEIGVRTRDFYGLIVFNI
jgi:hypothetical protein